MIITEKAFNNRRQEVKAYLMEEYNKMRESCISWPDENGIYRQNRYYEPEQQPNLAYYRTGTTSALHDYIEFALVSDIQENERRNITDRQVLRITNSEARLPAFIEYAKRAGMPYAPTV